MLSWSRLRRWVGGTVLRLALGCTTAIAITIMISLALINIATAQDVRPPKGADLSVVITPQPSDSDSWRQLRHGRNLSVAIDGPNAGVAIQSEGEDWRSIRNGPLSNYGVWGLAGIIVFLAVFFALRRRIRIEAGPSESRIERFNGLERFAHWLTAVTFIILALTGLNMLYGRYVLLGFEIPFGSFVLSVPGLPPDLFSALTLAGKYAHNFLAFGFMLGVILIFVLWVRQNIPNKHDIIWLAKGGGMLMKGVHPPAKKFNAGQKIIFWIVVLGGISISFSGIALLFPFQFKVFSGTFELMNNFGTALPTDLTVLQEMQLMQLWHAILGLVLIVVIIAHIYIGTLGMEGAFDAMGTGMVDANWAREHHNLWVAELSSEPDPSGHDSGAADSS